MIPSLTRAARAALRGGAACALFAAAAIPAPTVTPLSPTPPAAVEHAFALACQRALRSVVTVLGLRQVEGEPGPDGPTFRPVMSLASGAVVDRRGHVVTSAAVVRGCERIQVRLADGRNVPATLVGVDATSDVALLELPVLDVPPLAWAPPGADAAGSWVAAVGQSAGGRPRSSLGVVCKRYTQPLGSMLLLTNAVFPGVSGAPAVNARGELVGLVIGPLADAPPDFDDAGAGAGSSFALAGDDLRTLVGHLERYGNARRGFLGVRMVQGEVVDATHPDDPYKIGVRVEDVLPGSPAALCGLRSGDLIVGWNGETLASPEDLMRRVEACAPGAKAALVWVRGDDRIDGKLVVGAKPDDELLAEPQAAAPDVAPPAGTPPQLPELRPQSNPYLLDRVRSLRPGVKAVPDTARHGQGGT